MISKISIPMLAILIAGLAFCNRENENFDPKAKYGQEHDIRAMIDPMTGEQTLLRVLTVVTDEEFEDEAKQLRLVEAKKIDPSLEIGSELTEELPPFDFGRVAAIRLQAILDPALQVEGGPF